MPDEDLTLQQAADELGVHYMTAYRYVRLGQLDAVKIGGGWRVSPAALAELRSEQHSGSRSQHKSAPWGQRLESRLIAGDAAGAWGVVEASMAAGTPVDAVYLDVISPALHSIGDRWAAGEIDVAVEHRASGIAGRLVGRLGPRCVRRGRSRGCVLLGSPEGERHGLVVSILADLIRLGGWEVHDLGPDTPHESFVHAARLTDDIVAIGLSVTHPEVLESCATACAIIKSAGVSVPIVVGGQAIENKQHARSLGADAYADDAAAMVAFLDGLDGREALDGSAVER